MDLTQEHTLRAAAFAWLDQQFDRAGRDVLSVERVYGIFYVVPGRVL
jgi:hypothetical protein